MTLTCETIDDLLARMRLFEVDHKSEGWPAVQMREITALCDEIERLRALTSGANKFSIDPTRARRCPICFRCIAILYSEAVQSMVYSWHTCNTSSMIEDRCSNSYKPCDESVDNTNVR